MSEALVEHFFRHEAGRLIAVLTRIFGWRNFDLVEDMVQATLLDAMEAWRHKGAPENPAAWVHRVARNKIVDALRRAKAGQRVHEQWAELQGLRDAEIEDSQLRMIFACCHPALSTGDQLALTLHALCGFGTPEISRALLIGEEAAKKRLQRARRRMIALDLPLEPPADAELLARLDAVHQVLYLLFNEGYSPSRGPQAIREDLCEDAVWLCHLLYTQPRLRTPATCALHALLLLHAARLDSRVDSIGGVLLLEEQDRALWDKRLIVRAQEMLAESASGQAISRFHLEAAIACHHCVAADLASTHWGEILKLYDALLLAHRSPVYELNRAIVIGQLEGPAAGLRALRVIEGSDALKGYYLLDAALAEMYHRSGDAQCARGYWMKARANVRSPRERALIDRRMRGLPAD